MKKFTLPLALFAGVVALTAPATAQSTPATTRVQSAHPTCTAPMVWSIKFKKCVRPRATTVG